MGNLFLVILILAVAVLYFWMICPNMDRKLRRACLANADWDFAHRGLWDMEQAIPENSIPAFERAIRHGYAIEIDVRLTKDNQIVVIHDSRLNRLCGVRGTVEGMTYAELSRLSLCGTDCGIPLLGQVLHLVQGRVPLLIELKTPKKGDTAICSYAAKELEFYNGDFMIQSFDSFAIRWFRRNAPHVVTGQLACAPKDLPGADPIVRLSVWLLLVHVIGRPDFISYDLHAVECLSVRINQLIYRTPVFVWTVRSMNEYRQGTAQYSTVIFENFLP